MIETSVPNMTHTAFGRTILIHSRENLHRLIGVSAENNRVLTEEFEIACLKNTDGGEFHVRLEDEYGTSLGLKVEWETMPMGRTQERALVPVV